MDTPPPDYTALITAFSAAIAALTGLVAAIGVVISKLRGDRLEKGQQDAKKAVVDQTQQLSQQVQENTDLTQRVTTLVNGATERHEEERKALTDKVDELKASLNVATVKEAIRDVLAPPPGVVPKRATDTIIREKPQ